MIKKDRRLVVLYARVSTEMQGEDGLGIDDQLHQCRRYVEDRADWQGLDVEELVEVLSGSIAPDDRPKLAPALQRLDYDGGALVASHLDRVSRDLLDVVALHRRAAAAGWQLALLDIGIDTSTPAGEAMLGFLGVTAQMVRRLGAERTRSALQAAKRRGQRLGRPVETPDDSRARIVEMHQEGLSLREIARRLEEEGLKTARGGKWHACTVSSLLRSERLDREAKATKTSYLRTTVNDAGVRGIEEVHR